MHMLLTILACSHPSSTPQPASPAIHQPPEASAASATAPAGSGQPQALRFEGICDGSAAVRLDDGRWWVAYDEDTALSLFPADGGRYEARVELVEALSLGDDGELDLEGAARVGDRIWWIGSHGNDSAGEIEPNRRVLFATTADDRGVLLAGPFDLTLLLRAAMPERLSDAAMKRPPKEGGLNIEGLAPGPDGRLLVGLRSPLSGPDGMTGTAAVAVLAAPEGAFTIERVLTLELGDKGVRDLFRDGDEYVLIAGPVASGGAQELRRWDGASTTTTPIAGPDLSDLNPEAVARDGDAWLILSDDGKLKRPDPEAEDGDRTCDKIRKKSSQGDQHPEVYARGLRTAW